MERMNLPLLPLLIFLATSLLTQAAPFLGTGIKIGEVTQDSAVVWARLTSVKDGDPTSQTKAAPGAKGFFSVSFRLADEKAPFGPPIIVKVSAAHDHANQITLKNLLPARPYEIKVTAHEPSEKITDTLTGTFQTPPLASEIAPVTGAVVTCQGIGTVDDEQKGHRAYLEILKHQPDFFVHAGDVIYYDKDYNGKQPLSKDATAARQRWNRMFSYQWNRDFHRHLPSYFMKDDHDTLDNDSWPGRKYGDLTFAQGLAIFKEQIPHSALPYRTVSWGRDLQMWFLEGRDFRSPNKIPDGPEKTILGAEQKAWLKKSLRESKATFKLIMSPTPIVGPDKRGKKDNHANDVFKTEGDEIRTLLKTIPNLYIICGDRHWQYASRHPETGLIEIGCGPINDAHAKIGGNSGKK
ncbi:MAG: alkaline phosphatase D, partial [Akkermansiaceae bacterium]